MLSDRASSLLCLIKQEPPEQAAEAFRKLIELYPDQKELIAQAQQHLPPTRSCAAANNVSPRKLSLAI
jgi:hypothetical protein